MSPGKKKASRSTWCAHAAVLLAVGFVAGLSARSAADHLDAPAAMDLSLEPRDEYVVTPATDDAPAMVLWVAAELDHRMGVGLAGVDVGFDVPPVSR